MTDNLKFSLDMIRHKNYFIPLKIYREIEMNFWGEQIYPTPICPFTGRHKRSITRLRKMKVRHYA